MEMEIFGNVIGKLYFAHAVNLYGTPGEAAALAVIAHVFPNAEIENPNQPKHQAGYEAWAKRARESDTQHKGMSYFFDEVLPHCKGCIAMPFLDGRMGLGVAGETEKFLAVKKLARIMRPAANATAPGFEERYEAFTRDPFSGLFTISPITEGEEKQITAKDPALVVPHEETRMRTYFIYSREPKRPYVFGHLAPKEVYPWFYPPK